jgi:hypothetical protein
MRRLVRALMILALVALLAPLATGSAHAAQPYVGGQFRFWDFSNNEDLRDYLVYYVPGPFHVTLEYWDFKQGQDQFRPEIGIHLRDSRRSVYTVQWRHENRQERFWFGTEQILALGWVARADISPIVGTNSTQVVYSAGADYYWGSYNFASGTVIRDPREGGLWVVPLRVRLANEEDDWLQFGVAPASMRTWGWSVDLKYKGMRFGVETNNRYDFTVVDNTVFTFGFERKLGPTP